MPKKIDTDLALLVVMMRQHIDNMKRCELLSNYEGELARFEDRMTEWASVYMEGNK